MLLVVVLHVSAYDSMIKETLYQEECVLSHSYSSQYLPEYSLEDVQLPYLADGELGGVAIYLQPPVSFRTCRTSFDGFAYALRDMVQIISKRQAVLLRHWQKLSDSNLLSSITHPVSEYYVFALRRIVI